MSLKIIFSCHKIFDINWMVVILLEVQIKVYKGDHNEKNKNGIACLFNCDWICLCSPKL